MSPTLEEQIEKLKSTIADMEGQRDSLGDEFVDNALMPFQQKLDELVAMLEARSARSSEEPAQQRKLVTLLFMDVVGSTSIAQHMDPEDVSEVFDVALKMLAEPVAAHGGRVTRFMGDGFLSVFGAPKAREDDPEQAVRAGLEIIQRSRKITDELEEAWGIQGFQVRVGVNTGLVLLGGETEAEDTMMGTPVNLAARLESAAPPGGLLVSHDTYRHIRGVFDVQTWEPIQVKGFEEPVQVYRVLRTKPRTFRLHTRGVEGVETSMVGREAEIKLLQEGLLTAMEESEGQMVTIIGEAGVGKSRLLYEFQNWIELLPPPPVRLFEGRGRQEAQGLPYGLLRDLFVFRFQIQEDDSRETAREKVESGFLEVFGDGGERDESQMRAHILGQWLGFDFSASQHLKGVLNDAEQLHDRGLMYFVEYFQKLCETAPVVLFLEDIHWADDSSLDALNHLGQRIQRTRLLAACAARPTLFERRPYWGEGLAYHRRIDLQPLTKRESRQLVVEILKKAVDIPHELRELVVEGAEGNPFYVEELVKMLVEDGVIVKGEETWQVHPERLAEIEVPPTLAGVLQARLDSLPPQERVVLQQAAVVGRQFWDRLVAYIQASGNGREVIVPEALSALRQRELIYRREESAFANTSEFIFKHDILREVTYESVLKRLRRVYHGLVADWLIAQGAERAGEYNGLIAEHLLQAGRDEKAAAYFTRAGESALAAYANVEAEGYLRKALSLSPDEPLQANILAGLGESLGRQGREEEAIQRLRKAIDQYYDMGEYDRAADLYAHLSRVLWYGEEHQQAWQICEQGLKRLEGIWEGPGMARLLAEAGRTAFFRSLERGRVVSLCEKAKAMAQRLGVVEVQAEAGITLALLSDVPQESIADLKEIASLCEEHGLLRTAARAYFDTGYFCHYSMSGADQSYRYYMEAAEIDQRIGDIESMVFALINAGGYMISLGDLKSWYGIAREFLRKSSATEAQIEECLERPIPWILYFRGEWEQGLEYILRQLEEQRAGGNLQNIAMLNIGLANAVLELDRFSGTYDLAKAEDGLLENITIVWRVWESYSRLATISARKGRIQEAHEWLSQMGTKKLWKYEQLYQSQAEVELAFAEGHWDEAVSICREMIDLYQRGKYRWEWARQLIDLGDALLGRDRPGDRERAEEAYWQALEIFKEMDAPGYVRVLEERLEG